MDTNRVEEGIKFNTDAVLVIKERALDNLLDDRVFKQELLQMSILEDGVRSTFTMNKCLTWYMNLPRSRSILTLSFTEVLEPELVALPSTKCSPPSYYN